MLSIFEKQSKIKAATLREKLRQPSPSLYKLRKRIMTNHAYSNLKPDYEQPVHKPGHPKDSMSNFADGSCKFSWNKGMYEKFQRSWPEEGTQSSIISDLSEMHDKPEILIKRTFESDNPNERVFEVDGGYIDLQKSAKGFRVSGITKMDKKEVCPVCNK